MCNIIYGEEAVLDPANGGASTSLSWLANSCFDPRVAVGGHQPRGFDQLCELYGSFVCVRSVANVTIRSYATAAAVGCTWGLHVGRLANEYSGLTMEGVLERPVRSDTPGLYLNQSLGHPVMSGQRALWHAKAEYDHAKVFPGISLGDAELHFTAANDSNSLCFYEVFALSNQNLDAAPLPFSIQIVYTILCTNYLEPAAS